MDVPVALRFAICVLLAGATTGCHRGTIYYPSSLPPQFHAPQLSQMNRVDLSQLARSSADSELLYPGDLVSVIVSTGLEKEAPTEFKGRINEDGTVNIPLVGLVPIGGLRLPYAEQLIHDESVNRGKFVNPNVTLQIVNRRSNRVTVVGEVMEPGTYLLPASDSNVLSAISQAKGFTKDADTVIEVRHAASDGTQPVTTPQMAGMTGGPGTPAGFASFPNGASGPAAPPQSIRIDLEQASRMDPRAFEVGDGSTVMVMKQPKRYVHVIGLVRKPDQFEMPDDHEVRLLDAIAMAGGRTLEIADKVRVIRNVPDQTEPVVIEASVGDAKRNSGANIRLAPGDVVSVEETAATLIVGTVREFVRFGFTSAIPGF